MNILACELKETYKDIIKNIELSMGTSDDFEEAVYFY